jgi:hypothetical protein
MPAEMAEAQKAQEENFNKAMAAVRSLNKAELELIANGHYEGLTAMTAARESLPLKFNTVSDADGVVDTLYVCSRYFRETKNKAGLDAVIAAFKALTPAAQSEVKA